jgi:hypothetical protein
VTTASLFVSKQRPEAAEPAHQSKRRAQGLPLRVLPPATKSLNRALLCGVMMQLADFGLARGFRVPIKTYTHEASSDFVSPAGRCALL